MNEGLFLIVAGFFGGAVLASIVWVIAGGITRRQNMAEGNREQQAMSMIDQACKAIESLVSSTDLNSLNTSQFRAAVVEKVAAVRSLLDAEREDLDFYYVKYVERLLGDYQDVVNKLDEVRRLISRLAGTPLPVTSTALPVTAVAPTPAPEEWAPPAQAPVMPAAAVAAPVVETLVPPAPGTPSARVEDTVVAPTVVTAHPEGIAAPAPQAAYTPAVEPGSEPQVVVAPPPAPVAPALPPQVEMRPPAPVAAAPAPMPAAPAAAPERPPAPAPADDDFPLFQQTGGRVSAAMADAPTVMDQTFGAAAADDQSMEVAQAFVFGGSTEQEEMPPVGEMDGGREQVDAAFTVPEEEPETQAAPVSAPQQAPPARAEEEKDKDDLLTGDDFVKKIDAFFKF